MSRDNPMRDANERKAFQDADEIREKIGELLDAMNADLTDHGYGGITEDQRTCALDPARADEALEMLSHWQMRCDVPAELVDEACELIEQLETLSPTTGVPTSDYRNRL